MMGREWVLQAVGAPLEAIRVQRLFVGGRLVDPCNAVFLRAHTWMHVLVADGMTTVRAVDPTTPEFPYPTEPLEAGHAASALLGRRVLRAAELVWRDDPAESYGLCLHLERGGYLCVYHQIEDDRLELVVDPGQLPADLGEVELTPRS